MRAKMYRDPIDEWAVVDAYCGIGGLSHGFRRIGFNVVAGIDIDPSCKHAFETNNDARFIARSVDDVSGHEIESLYPERSRRILIGCAPCSPFSAYTPEAKKRKTDKWRLVDVFADRVMVVQPEIVSMENVPRLASFDDGIVVERFIHRLEQEYDVSATVVDCARYGVPQHRKRFVLLASKIGKIELQPPSRSVKSYRTVRDTIGEMPRITHGEECCDDRLHKSARLSRLNLERIRASRPGGSWEEWPEDLVAQCHQRQSGKSYKNVYGRMEWDKPAPTITGGCFSFGRGRFGHPVQDRAISLREAALLQTFPSEYEFGPSGTSMYFTTIGRQIGNAVPVALAETVARSIADHIRSFWRGNDER